jgi:hypothetical protein
LREETETIYYKDNESTKDAIGSNYNQLTIQCSESIGRFWNRIFFVKFAYEFIPILHEIRKRKANWISHILRRNCFLKQVIEGKIKGEMEVTRRRGRRRKNLLDYLKDRRGYSHLKEEVLDRTMWRNRFGRGFGPVVRQNTE